MSRPNLPNSLTIVRILLVPAMAVALLSESRTGDLIAGITFALASATDYVDGYLARRRDSITSFGKLMDPIADKLLVVTALFCLVSLDRLALWVALVIVLRELGVTVSRMLLSTKGNVVAAAQLGKLKTVMQVLAILLLIAFNPAPAWVDAIVYLAVLLTIVSGIDYVLSLRRAEARPAPS